MNDYSVKAIRQQFKQAGVFYTDQTLAVMMRDLLPEMPEEVYDPTCGNGSLLSVFPDHVRKYGQDINAEQVEAAARRLTSFTGASGDTLKEPAFIGKKFKAIVANPPFSIAWAPTMDERFEKLPCLPPKSKADYAFLAHILHYLSDDGTAVTLNFPGILYRGNAEGKIRQWFIENNYIDQVTAIDGGHFTDTAIATAIVVLKKNRTSQTVRFTHNELAADVPIEQIASEGFELSVSRYIDETPRKEAVNPVALEEEALASFLKNIDNELTFEETVRALEGWEMQPVYDAVRDIVSRHERRGRMVL